jgi:Ca-activated chloride channel family protein
MAPRWIVVLSLCVAPMARASQLPVVTNGGFLQTTGADGKPVVLPLRRTEVEAEVSGVVASVEVVQEFQNPYGKPIEATYLFPLPAGAAVVSYAFELKGRVVRGVVRERQQARRVYARARAQGKTAALLEEERPNAFTQSIANIMPRDRIRARIRYLELLSPSEGRYTFSFPMVVGPRYIGGGELARAPRGAGHAADTDRVPDASRLTPRLLAKGLRPGHDIALRLSLRSGGRPVRDLQVVTHKASLAAGPAEMRVVLDPSDAIPNKDFVVRYALAGKEPEVSLLAHRGARGEGHLLLAIQPPPRPAAAQIAPREHVFVIDNSGSMAGFPSQVARTVVRRLLATLGARDTFQLITFAGEPAVFAPRAVPARPASVRAAEAWLERTPAAGGTELIPALRAALLAPRDPARARIVLFLTDGFIGDEPAVLRFLRENLRGASLFALGVGSSTNRFLIDGLARIGGGEPFYLLDEKEAARVVGQVVRVLARPALTSIALDWGGLSVFEVSPRALPDLFAERPVVVTARYRRPGTATVRVRGLVAGRRFEQAVTVALPDRAEQNSAIPLLWARRKIAELEELETAEPARAAAARKETLRLALAYGLLSRQTSLVAVDHVVRNRGGKLLDAPVPLPLPAGTAESAAPAGAYVGRGAATTGGPDRDRDGIPDVDDCCPGEPEVWNGHADEDGCPDKGRIVVHMGRIEILDKIYFETGSATVKPVSAPILDAVAATLRGNPQIELVEVQGHADARGSRRDQERIALARARAVVAYLVARGVDPKRLLVRGYGATRPVDRRSGPDAWSRNRRVEWLILRRAS